MSRDEPLKSEKDFSATLDEQFPVIEKLKDYKLAVDKYLVLEKQTRQALDSPSSKRVLNKIADTLVANNDWGYLDELIPILSKKHGQLKSSIQMFVSRIGEELDRLRDDVPQELETKIKLIETIRVVTDKKIFVEVERAVVSKKLAEIYLNRFNDLDKAIEVLCDLQVETYSLMAFETKIEYILEQMSFLLRKQDFEQAKILSRKILIKTLKGFEQADQYKFTYLKYLLEIDTHESDYIGLVRHLLMLVDIPLVREDVEQLKSYLVAAIYYIILSPYDNEQLDLMSHIKRNRLFTKHVDPRIVQLLDIFTNSELIHWSELEADYGSQFAQSPIFASNRTNLESLQKRCVEHNLRVISQCYQLIQLDRLAALLQLSAEQLETVVSELVNKGMIFAKINRPQGVVKFLKADNSGQNVNDLLNAWCNDVDTLLEEVESIGHLINKEEMMHGIKQKA